MNIFLQTLRFKKFPIDEAIKRLREVQSKSEQEFDEFQTSMRWEIFKHHYNNNKNYKAWVDSKSQTPITSWEQIPVLTKKDLQRPVEERLTTGYTAKDVYMHNTSGSTGTPFFFAKDRFCHAMTWAMILDRNARHGIISGQSKQARFYGIPLGFVKNKMEKIKDLIANRVRFPIFDLSDAVLDKYFEVFKKHKFEYVNGYTSSLVLFANYLIRRGIVLKDVCPTLKVTFPTSEMCTEDDRKVLEKGFGIPVANEYGAAELDLIAFEDKDFDWILNEENLYIEIVDDNNQPVPNGQEGKVIITSLYNKAMPFVKYELGDVGTISTRKKGIYRILQSLTGRTNDVAILPGGKKSPGLTFYYISKKLLESGGFMKEFIIRQTSLSHFHYEYVADRDINDEEKAAVAKAMDTYLEPGLTCSFERKEVITRTKAGKLKHFQSAIK